MESIIEQIKERIDIVDLIQSYVRLQKAGVNYKALCPFHKEKTPSFFVSPSRQIWHCFGGCSEGGDHFKFLMKIEGIEFFEALRILAKKAGVELKEYERGISSEKNKLYEICELATNFFEKQLWNSESGKKALDYLKNRGLKEETIKEWRLGYAPNTWNSLKVFLKNVGYKEEEILKAGLIVKKEEDSSPILTANYDLPTSSSTYDRFRGRIIFPIFDLNNQVVGFAGRIFEELIKEQLITEVSSEENLVLDNQKLLAVPAKYINTPQTQIYDKSKILYGLNKAKLDIHKEDKVIVVEGNMDVIMSHQAGVKNVVASSGTSLTDLQLKILKRYTENLDLCFDFDFAGETATKRAIGLALAKGFNVGIIDFGILNENNEEKIKDVADLVKINPKKWQEFSKKTKQIIQFYIDKAFQKYDSNTAFGKKNIAKNILPMIKVVENKIEQSHWLDFLAEKLKVDRKILLELMAKIKINTSKDGDSEEEEIFEKSPRINLEETLLAFLFKMPAKAKEIGDEGFEIFQEKLYNDIFRNLKEKKEPISELATLYSYEDKVRIELIKFKADQFFADFEEKEIEREILRIVGILKKDAILGKIKEIEGEIKELKGNNSEEKKPRLLNLLSEVQELSKKLRSL